MTVYTISTAASLVSTFPNLVAGDEMQLRGGTYNISSQLATGHGGTSNTNRITVKNYTGETPNIVTTWASRDPISVRNNYWTIDGLSIHGPVNVEDSGLISTYDYEDRIGLTVKNCHLHMTSADGHSNRDVIYINRHTNALIQNNEIIAHPDGGGGVILFQGGGNRVLNNIISGGGDGIYQKHPNCGDTSLSTGAEWAYNWIISPSRGLAGRPKYINIHDNIVSGESYAALIFGDDGGDPGSCGTNNGNVVKHNTLAGVVYFVQTDMYGTFKNNILNSWSLDGGTTAKMTWDYNVIVSSVAVGAHDQGNTSVTYSGGASPSTIAGFALTSGSNGYHDGDDGKDTGADTTLVGFTTGVDVTPPFIDNLSPSGVLAATPSPRNITISCTTDEPATCRYGETDTVYASLTSAFTTTGDTTHSSVLSQTSGTSKTYYVRCQDGSGNVNPASSVISYSISNQQVAGPGGIRTSGGVRIRG